MASKLVHTTMSCCGGEVRKRSVFLLDILEIAREAVLIHSGEIITFYSKCIYSAGTLIFAGPPGIGERELWTLFFSFYSCSQGDSGFWSVESTCILVSSNTTGVST